MSDTLFRISRFGGALMLLGVLMVSRVASASSSGATNNHKSIGSSWSLGAVVIAQRETGSQESTKAYATGQVAGLLFLAIGGGWWFLREKRLIRIRRVGMTSERVREMVMEAIPRHRRGRSLLAVAAMVFVGLAVALGIRAGFSTNVISPTLLGGLATYAALRRHQLLRDSELLVDLITAEPTLVWNLVHGRLQTISADGKKRGFAFEPPAAMQKEPNENPKPASRPSAGGRV